MPAAPLPLLQVPQARALRARQAVVAPVALEARALRARQAVVAPVALEARALRVRQAVVAPAPAVWAQAPSHMPLP
jgi:hypothetical protein